MPRWLPRVLKRIHDLAANGRIRLTYRAVQEAEALGLAPDDVRDVLVGLMASDSAGRLVARRTGEWLYVFRPGVAGLVLYVKLVLREACVVVSFHEDEGDADEEDE